MPRLLLGPLLRHVDDTSATVWVEVDEPCEVEVLGCRARSFCVHGHHFALVDVDAPGPGTSREYRVALDGEQVWPPPGDRFPAPCIRTPDPTAGLRVAFGSCRRSERHDAEMEARWGVDALRTLAHRLLAGDAPPPDLLLLLGDQVYADEPSDEMDDLIRSRRDPDEPPGLELADFEEYAMLYRLAWSEPSIRWLLSTVPTTMVFDDHDIRDDWNTSAAWREDIRREPWWATRIRAGLGSYWVYQHLGNLSRAERDAEPLFCRLRDGAEDGGELLDAFAARADEDPPSYRWSTARDLGPVRVVVVDSRATRRLTPGDRSMLDGDEWAWLEARLQGDGPRHVLVASSLPVLLPDAIHHLQRWDEAVCDGAWGRAAAWLGERARRVADLEHWAAFGRSFEALERAVTELADGRRGTPPASVTFLSGDVHFSYLARVAPVGATRVAQAVCSPMRNPLERPVRWGNAVLQTRGARRAMRALARRAGVAPPAWRWGLAEGPWFDNAIATITLVGDRAEIAWQTPVRRGDDVVLEPLARAALA